MIKEYQGPVEKYLGEAFRDAITPASATNRSLSEPIFNGLKPLMTYVFDRFKG